MNGLKAIETEYKGYRFRSRLEARWAVFFDACGVSWEYEPEGYDLGNGLYYLPDFLLHGVTINHAYHAKGRDLYVEVKGQMTDRDAAKINRFAELRLRDDGESGDLGVLVVGNIPDGDNMDQIAWNIEDAAYDDHHGWPNAFNFETVDGDYFAAHPGIGKDGTFQLFGDDSTYFWDMNKWATERAYRTARQARFEHGETPKVRRDR